jgi:hypothetical protein
MSTTPHSDDGDPTVAIPGRPAAAPPTAETRRPLESLGSRRRRRAWLSAAAAIVLFAVAAAGSFYLVQRMKPLTVPPQRVQEAAAPPVTPQASQPTQTPPPPRVSDQPSSQRQMLREIFDGRDQGHAVTASVERGAVRIGSSTPGYVYVLAASTNQVDGAPLFVAMLFPRAADTNNRVRPGQTLTLPDLPWPAHAEFLAIVSDERRDIDVLGQLVGKVICPSSGRCSESYGAVAFSSEGIRATARNPAAPKAPAARPPAVGPRRCSDILERASLGEALTDEEQTFLTRDCR